MKNFAAIICFALLAVACADDLAGFTEEEKAKATEYQKACAKELNLTEAELAKIKAKDFSNPSENEKCFANCFFEKVGTLKNGVIQDDVVIAKFSHVDGEEKTRAILDKCRHLKGENNCETALKLLECYKTTKVSIAA